MRIFNQDKTRELNANELDLTKGHLEYDKLVIAHHEATPYKRGRTAQEVARELELQGVEIETGGDGNLYRVVTRYESGGADVEPILKEPDMPAKDAYDDYEDIQVYVPYTEQELAERRIAELKKKLYDTDYKAIKYAEGEISELDYEPVREQRRAWRAEINALETKLNYFL